MSAERPRCGWTLGAWAHGAGAALIALASPGALAAQEATPNDAAPAYALHGQATFVAQATPALNSPYAGPNSLTGNQARETFDATLYAGVRPWAGAELWANPEVDQGFGLSNTLGAAGFPSAEAYKVGKSAPYLRLQRLFMRQTIGLGGDREPVEAAMNQLGGRHDADRLVITLGKFAVGDVFDTNAYAHDPRGDFLNWSLVDAGTFDYAADAWGYSTGVAVELYRGAWTVRAGGFNLSRVPNGETLETGFGQYQIDAEVEHRHRLGGHAGAVRLMLFRNHGRFSRYADAIALASATGQPVDPASTRAPRSRIGASVNVEQAIGSDIGLFARAGVADGSIEPYDFTDIDRTAQLGVSAGGNRWGRAADTVGIALVVNGISREHQRYLDAGGLGLLIGDGRLPHPGAEVAAETYYQFMAFKGVAIAVDYQLLLHPGYNRDRGPANIVALRLHGAF